MIKDKTIVYYADIGQKEYIDKLNNIIEVENAVKSFYTRDYHDENYIENKIPCTLELWNYILSLGLVTFDINKIVEPKEKVEEFIKEIIKEDESIEIVSKTIECYGIAHKEAFKTYKLPNEEFDPLDINLTSRQQHALVEENLEQSEMLVDNDFRLTNIELGL